MSNIDKLSSNTFVPLDEFAVYGQTNQVPVSNVQIVRAWNGIRTPWCVFKEYQAMIEEYGVITKVEPFEPIERYLELGKIDGFDNLFSDESTRIIVPNLQEVLESGKAHTVPRLGASALSYILGFAEWAQGPN